MLAKVMVLGCLFQGDISLKPYVFFPLKRKDTLPETNKLPMKMEGWKMMFAPKRNGSHLSRLPQLHQIYPHQKYGLIEGFLIIGFPE